MRFILIACSILLFSCADPLGKKLNESTFENDILEMVESKHLTQSEARKITCTQYLGIILGKDLSLKSYEQILSSFSSKKDELSFVSMSKEFAKRRLDSVMTCELFKVQRKKVRGKVYFGFMLTNQSNRKVVAYSGVVTILDVFGKPIYTGPFENKRKHIGPQKSREFWVKLDRSNSEIGSAMKDVEFDVKWESETIIFQGGEAMKAGVYNTEASEEFEFELKSFYSNSSII